MALGDPLQPFLHGDPLNLGYDFARPELLAEALTHRSALDRQPDLKAAFPNGNERLEFLGDRVLSLAMADLLLRRFPHEREGDLARRYSALVQAATLVEVAKSISLGAALNLGDSERQSGVVRPTILADAMEAVLGALFLDAGFAVAATTIERLWGERLSADLAAPRDAKTTLQEWAQARRLPLPSYREVGREGPAHAPVFVVDVSIKGQEPGRGRAGNKREAERLAAAALLERLGTS
ncbi:MAG TPA: ribonuclease III [Reyranella sp.]